jgi:hypothetical protein
MQTSFQKMLLAFIGMSMAVTAADAQPSQAVKVVARGGGKTIIQGGTGQAGGFVPVITTIAFHAEREGKRSPEPSSVWLLSRPLQQGMAVANSQ